MEPPVYVSARINGNEVIAQGSLLFPKDEVAQIHPFVDEPRYAVGISVIVDNDMEKPIDVDGKVEDHYTLTWRMRWVENKPIAYAGLIVAHAEGLEYTLNSVFTLIGTAERYFVDFRYNILRKAT